MESCVIYIYLAIVSQKALIYNHNNVLFMCGNLNFLSCHKNHALRACFCYKEDNQYHHLYIRIVNFIFLVVSILDMKVSVH